MTISFVRHRFLPAIIWHAVWLYLRFTLSHRDVLKFGPLVSPRTSPSTPGARRSGNGSRVEKAILGELGHDALEGDAGLRGGLPT
jgi:hypothetical protein